MRLIRPAPRPLDPKAAASHPLDMNPKLNARFSKATKWRAEGLALRKVLLECGLTEELKWGKPLLHG